MVFWVVGNVLSVGTPLMGVMGHRHGRFGRGIHQFLARHQGTVYRRLQWAQHHQHNQHAVQDRAQFVKSQMSDQ